MLDKFQEGQRIVLEELIHLDDQSPVPPGKYVIVEVIQGLLGNASCRIRLLPDEDLEVEVDLETLSASAKPLEE